MPKKGKKTQHQCKDHVFELKPLYNQSKLPDKTCISFCKNYTNKNQTKTLKIHSSECLSFPIYNSDHNHATPSFILQEDKVIFDLAKPHFKEQGQRLKQEHDMKMRSYLDEKESLNVPKPKTKTNHCNVCRQPYEDYLMHIQSEMHHEKTKNNIYTKYIDDLAHRFELFNLRNKSKSSMCSHHTLTTQIEDEKEIPELGGPKKKIKTEGNDHEEVSIQNKVPKESSLNNADPEINNQDQAMHNTGCENYWRNPYFYPIWYPCNYQAFDQAENMPLPYCWTNFPYFYQFNYNNAPQDNYCNQIQLLGNQQFATVPQTTLLPTQFINQNILENQ